MPEEKRLKYKDFGIPSQQIETLLNNQYLDTFLSRFSQETAATPESIKLSANYLTSDAIKLLGDRGTAPEEYHIESMQSLCALLIEDKITSRTAKDLLSEVLYDGIDPEAAAKERGLLQSNDTEALRELVQALIVEHPSVVSDYKDGKESSIQYLVGQGMKQSKGSANPKMLLELLKKELD